MFLLGSSVTIYSTTIPAAFDGTGKRLEFSVFIPLQKGPLREDGASNGVMEIGAQARNKDCDNSDRG